MHCWQAIRLASESEDMATAQAIMESGGLTSWSAETVDCMFCYDDTGKKYEVPFWVLHLPRNLLSDEQAQRLADQKNRASAVQGQGEPMTIKLRLSVGGVLLSIV